MARYVGGLVGNVAVILTGIYAFIVMSDREKAVAGNRPPASLVLLAMALFLLDRTLWRMVSLSMLLNSGRECPGVVNEITIEKSSKLNRLGGYRIVATYTFQGHRYQSEYLALATLRYLL